MCFAPKGFYGTYISIWFLSFRGDWKELEFKEYNFNAKGPPAEAGHLHPLLKARIGLFSYQLHLTFSKWVTIKITKRDISLLNICINFMNIVVLISFANKSSLKVNISWLSQNEQKKSCYERQ